MNIDIELHGHKTEPWACHPYADFEIDGLRLVYHDLGGGPSLCLEMSAQQGRNLLKVLREVLEKKS